MAWHHIIPKHEWKKRFGNLEGVNAPDNLVNLTTEQHAQVHFFLWEMNGSEYDKIAHETISGQIGKEEAVSRVVSVTNTGRIPWNKGMNTPDEVKRKLSISHMGQFVSKETKIKLSLIKRGRKLGKFSEEHLRKLRGPRTKITCTHCNKTGGSNTMRRWHFDNCKQK